jgi:hypothetical protein
MFDTRFAIGKENGTSNVLADKNGKSLKIKMIERLQK